MTDDIYDSSKIKLIDNSKYVSTVEPIYVVLGMLCEYLGRNIIEGHNAVESFYPKESHIADKFAFYLEKIAKEQKIQTKISIVKSNSGHITIENQELVKYIDNLYPHNFEDNYIYTDSDGKKYKRTNSGIEKTMFPKITSYKYKPKEVDCRYSYLYGAYIRYGEGEIFRLYNAKHKVELIIDFLETLNCDWVSWKRSLKGAPIVHEVSFGADLKLATLLGIE